MASPSWPTGPPFSRTLAIWLALGAVSTGGRCEERFPVLDGVDCAAEITLPCDTVRHHLGLSTGAELTAGAVDRALRRLWDSGLFDDLDLTAEAAAPGRARLVITATERPVLETIRFDGIDRLTRTRIEEWLETHPRPPIADRRVDRTALERLRADLDEFLRDRGQPGHVRYRLVPVAVARVEAIFALGARPPEPILASIEFTGATAIAPARLRRVMRHNRVATAGARLSGRGRLDPERLGADRDALEQLYQEHGYKDVEVGTPRASEKTGRHERVGLIVPIREGQRWRLGGLSIRGNRVLGDRSLLALFEREDVFSRPAVERWRADIRRLYAERGRIDTVVTHRESERPDGRVDVEVSVDEGPELSLGRLTVTGNRRTADTVLRRDLQVDEGQVLDLVALDRGLARLRARGLFEPAAEPFRVTRRDDGSGLVDLALLGRDADPYRIDFGGGWSDTDGLSGHLTLEARNLFGRGVAAGLRTTHGSIRDRLELFVADPTFLGRRQTLSGELFDRERRLTPAADQVQERQERGLRLAWSRPAGRRQSLRLNVTRSRLEDFRRLTATEPAPPATSFDRFTLAADWVLDRRDDAVRPTRGLRARLSLAASQDHGVGGREVLAPRAGLWLFRPLGKAGVLAARVNAGVVRTSGAAPASPLDAVFLGGPHSVRGFTAGSLFARDDDGQPLLDADGFRLGGDRFLEAGVEARFSLATALTGVVFVDGGQIWADGQSLDLDRPRRSAGIELWLRPRALPLPVRLTWAHNLDPLPSDEFDRFLIGLGAAF